MNFSYNAKAPVAHEGLVVKTAPNARPNKSLIAEISKLTLGQPFRDSCDQSIVQLDLRCAKVRLCRCALANLHDRVRLFGAAADDASWPM